MGHTIKVETQGTIGTEDELTAEEIESVEKDNEVHGVEEDTERIHLHVMTIKEAMKNMDWTNIGMIMQALERKTNEKLSDE